MKGLLGGTFDPPHYGHLVLAEEARLRFELDEVLFVPSRRPPHKERVHITPYRHRREMILLAIAGNPAFSIADLEPENEFSYTVDLIENVAECGQQPVFILGMDSLMEIHTWKDPDRLLDIARVVVGTRPGFAAVEVDRSFLERIEMFTIPGLHISSTDLRERFAHCNNTRYLTPDEVRSYVAREGLYGSGKGC